MQIILKKVGHINMYIQKSKVFSLLFQMAIGFIFASAFGFLLHFIFQWSGESSIAAAFSPVNESPWEHLKIVYYPVLLFLIIQLIYLKNKRTLIPNLVWSTALSALLAMISVTVLYYTYSGIAGKNIMWVDISIFFVSLGAAYIFNYKMLKSRPSYIKGSKLTGLALLAVLCAMLVVFTYFTPHIPWFQDPGTGSYGIAGKAF